METVILFEKPSILIIGADDKKFDEKGMRILHDVDYRVPTYNEISTWMKSACEPQVTGIKCETVSINNSKLFIISIRPTFELHETKRELITPKQFNEHVVFMRQGDNTIPASVREGVEIQQLKQAYRHEVANPSASWLGALIGGLVTLLLWGGESKMVQSNPTLSPAAVRLAAITAAIIFGAEIGWLAQQFNSTRYDWRYWTNRKRVGFVLSMLLLFVIMYFWQIRK